MRQDLHAMQQACARYREAQGLVEDKPRAAIPWGFVAGYVIGLVLALMTVVVMS